MESSTPEVSFEVQQQKIFSLLDFVMKCNRNHRFASMMLEPENSFASSMMKDAVLDSAIVVEALTVLRTSEDENDIANAPKEHVEDNLPKFHPPRKGYSAVRHFPPGCGRGAPPVIIQRGSKCSQNDGSRTKKRHSYNEAASTIGVRKSSASSFSGASPISHRTGSEDHKFVEDKIKKSSGNEDGSMEGKSWREFDGVESKLGGLGTGPESIAKRVVVQALNASPNCPWRQGKRMFKSTNRNLEG